MLVRVGFGTEAAFLRRNISFTTNKESVMKTEGLNVLVVGSGAREDVLRWTIKQSPRVAQVFCSPGNGGMPSTERRGVKESDSHGLYELVLKERIDFVVVGPELPLVSGITDFFTERGVPVFGPTKAAAHIEGSKGVCKRVCQAQDVPTPEFKVATSYKEAEGIIRSWGAPVVIKADGICAGKGVKVAESEDEALEAAHDALVKKIFGDAGSIILIERCVKGRECSVMVVCDGDNAVVLPPARDYKRNFYGDKRA